LFGQILWELLHDRAPTRRQQTSTNTMVVDGVGQVVNDRVDRRR
jgi:hypothetical protein